jgi:hypothetical protein
LSDLLCNLRKKRKIPVRILTDYHENNPYRLQSLERDMDYDRDFLRRGIAEGHETSDAVLNRALRAIKVDYHDVLN